MKNNYFGQKLKELRLEQHLSQKELGAILGFCNQTISFWESAKREPDLDSLIAIAKYFNVSIDFLLGLD
ncbi:MAG: helix-turn-helix domain-containing protein [Candidatus Coproplasma sp.]